MVWVRMKLPRTANQGSMAVSRGGLWVQPPSVPRLLILSLPHHGLQWLPGGPASCLHFFEDKVVWRGPAEAQSAASLLSDSATPSENGRTVIRKK